MFSINSSFTHQTLEPALGSHPVRSMPAHWAVGLANSSGPICATSRRTISLGVLEGMRNGWLVEWGYLALGIFSAAYPRKTQQIPKQVLHWLWLGADSHPNNIPLKLRQFWVGHLSDFPKLGFGWGAQGVLQNSGTPSDRYPPMIVNSTSKRVNITFGWVFPHASKSQRRSILFF